MNVVLTLDDDAIVLDNLLVTVSNTVADEDVSGHSAQSLSSDKGQKPMDVKVTGFLPYQREATLTTLFALSRKRNSDGSRQIFIIGNATARAVQCRRVRFSGSLNAAEQQHLLGWHISFSLKEVASIPEQQEQRVIKPGATPAAGPSFDEALKKTESNRL